MSLKLTSSSLRGRCAKVSNDFVYFGYNHLNGITLRKFTFDGNLILSSPYLGTSSCGDIKRVDDILYLGSAGTGGISRWDLNFNQIVPTFYGLPPGSINTVNRGVFVNNDYVVQCRVLFAGHPNVTCWNRETRQVLWSYELPTSAESIDGSVFGKIYIGRARHAPTDSNLTVLDIDGNFIQNELINAPTFFGVPAVNIFGHSLCMGNLQSVVKTDLNFNPVFTNTFGNNITAIAQDADYNIYCGYILGNVRKFNSSGGFLNNISVGGKVNDIAVRKGRVFVAHNRSNNITNTAITDDLNTVLWTFDHGAHCNTVTT